MDTYELVYRSFDNMENHAPQYTVHVPLAARDLPAALLEAAMLYAQIQPFQGYDGNTYPQNPRVRLEYPVALQPR